MTQQCPWRDGGGPVAKWRREGGKKGRNARAERFHQRPFALTDSKKREGERNGRQPPASVNTKGEGRRKRSPPVEGNEMNCDVCDRLPLAIRRGKGEEKKEILCIAAGNSLSTTTRTYSSTIYIRGRKGGEKGGKKKGRRSLQAYSRISNGILSQPRQEGGEGEGEKSNRL